MSICLNMIVKDEEKNLERLFASIYKYIDYFIISDTGSTDNTVQLLKDLGELYNIPGKVVSHKWQDFAHNRQLALEYGIEAKRNGEHNCEWFFIVDADEELKVLDKHWKSKLEKGYSYTTYRKLGGLTYKRLFLLWAEDQHWKWKGKIHEYLENDNKQYLKGHTNDIYIKAYQSEGSHSRNFRDAYEKSRNDIDLLLSELESVEITSGNVHRFFQLAYAYRDLNDLDSALAYLKKIIDFSKVSENFLYISLVFSAKYLMALNRELELARLYLEKAIEIDKQRKEAYYYMSVVERKKGNHLIAKKILEIASDLPFFNPQAGILEEDIYSWKIGFDLAFICFQLGEYSKSLQLIKELTEGRNIPEFEEKFLLGLKSKIAGMPPAAS